MQTIRFRRLTFSLLFPLSLAFAQDAVVEIDTSEGNGADAFIRAAAPDTNYGGDYKLEVKDNDSGSGPGLTTKTYLKFDLARLGEAYAAEVSLKLVVDQKTAGVAIPVYVYGLNEAFDSWGEGTITWNNAPANTDEQASGGNPLVAPFVTGLGSFTVPAEAVSGDEVVFTSLSLRNYINADTNGIVTLILIRNGDNAIFNLQFASKETLLLEPEYYPSLRITEGTFVDTDPPELPVLNHTTITPESLTIGPEHNFSGPMNGRSFQQDAMTTYLGWQYAGYLTGDRTVAVARRKVGEETWESVVVPNYTVLSNDAHNIVSIGVCPKDGTLHFAFDHHVDTLHYVVSEAGLLNDPENADWSAASFSSVRNELYGTALGGVTYPRFITTPAGDLLLTYRLGGSGSGDTMLYHYDGTSGQWSFMGKMILRSGTYNGLLGSSSSRNAYFDRWQYDDNGRLHVTWTFRETPTYSSNHDIHYVYSDDNGQTWMNNAGELVAATGTNPITIDTPGIVVVPVTQKRWIINTSAMLVDTAGRVHVMARHIPASEPLDSTIRTYHHYWRDLDGTWHGTELSQTGLRPKLVQDAGNNLYLVYSQSNTMGILYATSVNKWTDWQPIEQPAVVGIRMGSEAQVDYERMREGILSIFYTEAPESGIWGNPEPLRVIEYPLPEGQTWAGYPMDEGGNVDTKGWIGWINASLGPWIWSYSLAGWIYLPEQLATVSGAWVYIPRSPEASL